MLNIFHTRLALCIIWHKLLSNQPGGQGYASCPAQCLWFRMAKSPIQPYASTLGLRPTSIINAICYFTTQPYVPISPTTPASIYMHCCAPVLQKLSKNYFW